MGKSKYMSPAIVRSVAIEMDAEILGGSIVDQVEGVKAIEQDVVEHDFSDATTFNHSWEGE